MNLEEFKGILDRYGIGYRESGVSLVLETCPACGSRTFRVRLRVHGLKPGEGFFGRCQKGSCEEGYSSFKYLLKIGVPHEEVAAIHGQDPSASLKQLDPVREDFVEAFLPETVKDVVEKDLDISKFFKIPDWLDHPVAKYAIKRGVQPEHYNTVRIDHENYSVVFICWSGETVLGFQKRFISATNQKDKTRSSLGFQRSEHILEFSRDGADIAVCEGPFTALSAWHFDYHGVCTFGSNISDKQVELILQLANKKGTDVGVAFEDDAAGRKCFDKLRKTLYWENKKVYKIVSDTKGDLNDVWQKGGKVWRDYDAEWGGPAIPDISEMFGG